MKKIVAAAMDMGSACQAAVRKNLPDATTVFDNLRIVKLVNSPLDAPPEGVFRPGARKWQAGHAGTRFLPLKNPEDPDGGEGGKSRLGMLKGLDTPITVPCLLKGDIRQIWPKKDKAEAGEAVSAWIATARGTGEPIIARLSKPFKGTLKAFMPAMIVL
jgi:hypothetical protein